MRKKYLIKDCSISFIDGEFFPISYDGTYVLGTFVDLDGNYYNYRFTLSEIAIKLHEFDGHNYKVFWGV